MEALIERLLGRPFLAAETGGGDAGGAAPATVTTPPASDEGEPSGEEPEGDEADSAEADEGEEIDGAKRQAESAEPVDDGTEEIELSGKKLKIPRELKPLLMFQGDYTQKTQQLAEQRRALEAQAEQQAAVSAERLTKQGQLAHAQHVLHEFENLPWDQLMQTDPQAAQANQINWQRWQQAAQAIHRDIATLDAKAEEGRRARTLEAQQETVRRVQEAAATYHREIPNWKQISSEVIQFGKEQGFTAQELGLDFTRPELGILSDTRIGKLLHAAWQQSELAKKQKAAVQQKDKKLKEADPAPLVTVAARNGGPGPKVTLDKANMDQFVQIRQRQLAEKAKAARR